jgi:hypothetical protein
MVLRRWRGGLGVKIGFVLSWTSSLTNKAVACVCRCLRLAMVIDRILRCAHRRTPRARINQQPPGFIRTFPLRQSRRALCGRDGDVFVPVPQHSMIGAALIMSSLSNEICESTEDVLPRWTFISMNPDAVESVLPLGERTDAPSSSCKIRPAVTTASGIPVTCPSTAAILTSTAGLAHAEGGAELLAMRETVIDDDCALRGLSTGTLRCSTSRNDSSAAGSRGCSLRVTTAEYASGSSHIESSRSGSGLWDELKNLKDDVLLKAEDRPIDDIL